MKDLKAKMAEASRLREEFEVALALQQAFPGIFDGGGVKVALVGVDSGSPHARIEKADGSRMRKELEEMPAAWLERHASLILERSRRPGTGHLWKKAAERLEL